MSENMNGNRPLIMEKPKSEDREEKIKDLIDKNEKLEKELLKMNIQIKTLEDKLKLKTEREYMVI
jgi:hypothetical protein